MNSELAIAVQLNNVSKLYPSKTALNNISLSLRRGQIYGLIGRNGAGKTTLLQLISGDEQATLGEIIVAPGLLVGMVSTDDHFPDNLSLKQIDKLFSYSNQTWLAERYWHLAKQFKLTPEHKYGKLSTGEKAGVRLAVLFARKTEVWLIDEATQGLDALAQEICLSAFLTYFEQDNPCCIFCSHNLYEVERLADQVLVQKDAEIGWQGATQNLISRENSFSEHVTELFKNQKTNTAQSMEVHHE